MENEMENNNNPRRKFLKFGLIAGGTALVGMGVNKALVGTLKAEEKSGTKVKVLMADGKLVEVDSAAIEHPSLDSVTHLPIREGLPGKKFVRVIDLARCANARKCVEGCQKAHNMASPYEYLKVRRMQDAGETAPYWFPQMCFHCDNPPCTKVCPVDATFKRSDGIVAIDSERCVGCRFCMAACPYSARTFNWGSKDHPQQAAAVPGDKSENYCPTPPTPVGTVSKCDFCPDRAAQGLLPSCVLSCPNGTIFHGDANEDTVSNGEETFRLSELLAKRGGYRYMEELGTEPRVYYLPPVNRMFPFEEDTEKHNTHE